MTAVTIFICLAEGLGVRAGNDAHLHSISVKALELGLQIDSNCSKEPAARLSVWREVSSS